MDVLINEYPEVLFSVLYILICLVLFIIFALTEGMKERASLPENEDTKRVGGKDINDKGDREKRK